MSTACQDFDHMDATATVLKMNKSPGLAAIIEGVDRGIRQ